MKNIVVTSGGLSGLGDYIAEKQLSKAKNPFPYSGLWVFTGAQGQGKTLLMMHTLQQIHYECPDAVIVSDMNIYGVPCLPYQGIGDFEKYSNGQNGIIFVLDEIQTLFSSLESKNMPVSQLTIWSQNRKNRRLILGTSQRFSRIGKPLREQCTYNYETSHPLFGKFFRYKIYDGSLYDDQGKYTGDDLGSYWFVPRVTAMRMYNTLEVIDRDKYVEENKK